MIDNFALLVTHVAILYLLWSLIKTPDPDDPSTLRKPPHQRRFGPHRGRDA